MKRPRILSRLDIKKMVAMRSIQKAHRSAGGSVIPPPPMLGPRKVPQWKKVLDFVPQGKEQAASYRTIAMQMQKLKMHVPPTLVNAILSALYRNKKVRRRVADTGLFIYYRP